MLNNMKDLYNQTFCLSGFKENDMHIRKFLVQFYNAKFSETITKDTNFLITKELDLPYPSGKIKMAYRYNIPIIDFSEWSITPPRNLYLDIPQKTPD